MFHRKEKKPNLDLSVNVPGPMTMTGFARGLETLMMDLVSDKELSEKILQFSSDAISEEFRFVPNDIADSVLFASASDDPDIVGTDDYEKYTLKHKKELVREVHSEGYLSVFHPYGVFSTDVRTDILSNSIVTGTDGFQFSEGDEPEGILGTCNGRCCILGGVDAFSTLLPGPEKRIVRDTNRFIDSFKGHSYIMTCTPSDTRCFRIRCEPYIRKNRTKSQRCGYGEPQMVPIQSVWAKRIIENEGLEVGTIKDFARCFPI